MYGALFVGTNVAKVHAMNIFRQLNKVVLATVDPSTPCVDIKWESALARKRKEDIVVTRTAIIGQLFALLSGVKCLFKRFSLEDPCVFSYILLFSRSSSSGNCWCVDNGVNA
jgi:hypothetical protein